MSSLFSNNNKVINKALEQLSDNKSETRCAALGRIEKLGPDALKTEVELQKIIQRLISATQDTEKDVRLCSLMAIKKIQVKGSDIVNALIECLKDFQQLLPRRCS